MKTGHIIAAAMVALGAISAVAIFSTDNNHTAEKEQLRSTITLYDNKKMYSQAVQTYQQLIDLSENDYDLVIEYKEYCKEHDFQSEYISACQSALSLKSDDFRTAKEYLEIMSSSGNKSIYDYVKNEINIFSDNEKTYFSDYYDSIKGNYKIMSPKFSEISDWHSNTILYRINNGYVFLSGNEEYALATDVKGQGAVIDRNGSTIRTANEILSYSPSENLVAAHDDEQIVYLNANGQRSIVPFNYSDNSLVYYDYISGFSNGVACYKEGDKWGYINTSANVVLADLECATPFENGVAAEKSNGKWRFIKLSSDGFEGITDYIYDDVLLDKYGYPFSNGYAYVKESGSAKWSLIRVKLDEDRKSITGVEKVGSLSFDDAKPFGIYGAVAAEGKWGFITPEGEWLIEPQYDDAGSMASNLAPVKISDKWGYIDANNKTIIEPTFDYAGSFNNSGIAPIFNDGQWKLIQLLEYAYKAER